MLFETASAGLAAVLVCTMGRREVQTGLESAGRPGCLCERGSTTYSPPTRRRSGAAAREALPPPVKHPSA